MTKDPEYTFTEDELNWLAMHLDDAEGWTREEQVLRRSLITTFVLGLGIHVIGFAMASGVFGPAEEWPGSLAADLLASVGMALWTAAAIVVFLEVWPRATARRTLRFYRSAVATLRERGYKIPAHAAEAADPVQAKLDAILTRVGAIEAAVAPTQPDAPST